jgi:hypothetical protein
MAIATPAEINLQDELRRIAQQLDAAKHGKKSSIVDAATNLLGWSQDKLYRELAKIGWGSARVKRKDAGQTKVTNEMLATAEAMRMLSQRKNGKLTMGTPVALSILSQNGFDANVSVSTLNRQFRQRASANSNIKTDSPSVTMRSLHPNHVHQVDPSLCLIYYTKEGKQQVMGDDEFYKNKPANFAKVKMKCWRYVLTDHFSATIIVRYFAAEGENSENLWEFLCYAWKRMAGRTFSGVPKLLYWDKGSANTSGAIKNALDELDVDNMAHIKGNARAKGSVEGGNNLVETQFECRLKLEPLDDVQQLNAAVEHWYNAYNSNSIPSQDTRLNRPGMRVPAARYGLWQTIKAEQLRDLPNIDVCQALLSRVPVERTVSQNLTVSFKHHAQAQVNHYSLKDCAGVLVGSKVMVSAKFYSQADAKVVIKQADGSQTHHVLSPIAYDPVSGMPLDAPVFGENYQALPDTQAETRRKDADKLAYPGLDEAAIDKAKDKQVAPFGGLINAHSHLDKAAAAAPGYMQKKGTVITPPSAPKADESILDLIDLKSWLLKRLFRDFEPHEFEWLHANFTTVKHSQLNGILTQLRNGVPHAPALRVVNN